VKNYLSVYIQTAHTKARARCTNRIGWHGGVFVLPTGTLGTTNERVLYQSATVIKHSFKRRGTLMEWQQNVASRASGNSRALFAIACAFAPPLLELAAGESGGFHLRGGSSTGKTKLLACAASVWGSPEYTQLWRATANGLEGLAQLHNDGLLILDEIAQVDPKDAGGVAYMLSNGSGKVRASQEGLARKPARWRLLYLSSGEISLSEHAMAGGKTVKAGQEVRLVDIPAEAGKEMGVFEHTHGAADSATFARDLHEATGQYYGTAGIAFLEYVVANLHTLPQMISQHRRSFTQSVITSDASGQVERVAARFALVAFAGELASSLGITGWQGEEAENAVKTCFHAWLEARGGAGSLEKKNLLSDIRAQLEAHSESRFSALDQPDGKVTINRMGFTRQGENGREYVILPEAFRRELCKGHDSRQAVKVLHELGVLLPDSGGQPQRRESLPGFGRSRCYVIQSSKLWEADHGD
jgi:putative DNA primase/helicase